ncbi:hypothetical protein SAY86_028504 [Trapa natans]|uniref:Uncharacterized protein n=1 Tax=Trapa natans TaxID=22666 RepID=A0AAN7MIK4_TRANT|nr:hypothetical protein SAY86_028504 [Trapa natans]
MSKKARILRLLFICGGYFEASGSFGGFHVNGNLGVMSKDGVTQWSTKLKAANASYNRTVKLMDTGNLVLLEKYPEMED